MELRNVNAVRGQPRMQTQGEDCQEQGEVNYFSWSETEEIQQSDWWTMKYAHFGISLLEFLPKDSHNMKFPIYTKDIEKQW